jgi:hypothetical protein
MSNRSVRRVPLEFDWPTGEKWEGYINPYHKKFIVCEHCRGDGISKEARALERIWYGTTPPEYDPKTNIVDFGKIECEYGFIFHFTRHSHTRSGVFYLRFEQDGSLSVAMQLAIPRCLRNGWRRIRKIQFYSPR